MAKWQTSVFFEKILPAFKEQGFRILKHSDINAEGAKCVKSVFKNEIESLLTPIKLDPGHPFPILPSKSINLAVLLEDPRDNEQKLECAIVNVPQGAFKKWRRIDEEYALEDASWTSGYLPVEEIITHHIGELFGGMKIIGVHPFRVTRNADIERNEEEAEDLLAMIAAELRERKCVRKSDRWSFYVTSCVSRFAPFVRLEINEGAPDDLIDLLTSELHLDFDQDVYKIDRLVDQSDLFELMALAEEFVQNTLLYPRALPQNNHRLAPKTLRRKDLNRSGSSWKDRRSIFSIIRSLPLPAS